MDMERYTLWNLHSALKLRLVYGSSEQQDHMEETSVATTSHTEALVHCLDAAEAEVASNPRLAKYVGGINTNCGLSNDEEETQDHLFFMCAYARSIWDNTCNRLNFKCMATSLQGWLHQLLSTTPPKLYKDLLYTMFTAAIYYIWKARNDLMYYRTPKGWKTTSLYVKEYIRKRILYKAPHIRSYQNYIDLVLEK